MYMQYVSFYVYVSVCVFVLNKFLACFVYCVSSIWFFLNRLRQNRNKNKNDNKVVSKGICD